MVCHKLPFSDLGFVQIDENLWIKYTNDRISVPHFALSTTINPTSQTFLVRNIILDDTFSTNSYDSVKEFILKHQREDLLNKLID